MRLGRRLLPAVAAVAVAALAVAGCGSPASGSAAGNGNSALNAAGSGGAGTESVTDYLAYTDGRAGKANPSLPPVDIGWLNQQGGISVIGPLATNGAQMAVNYINAELGGVDGHPLKLVTCFITASPQEATACGQKFAADHNIDVIGEGGVDIGNQQFYQAISGRHLPVVVGISHSPIDPTQPNAVILFGDSSHVLGPIATYATQVLHARTAALVYSDDPAFSGPGVAAIEAGLKAAGVTVKAVGFEDSQTDLTGALIAAGAQTADMVVLYGDVPSCVNLATSLIRLGITDAEKIVAAPTCVTGQVAASLGDFPQWTYAIASSLYGDPTDPGMPAYEKVARRFSTPADAPDPWNIVAFSQVLTIDRFLNQLASQDGGVTAITPAQILAKARAFTGPVALGAPSLKCGQFTSAPAVCNDRSQFFEYEGKGKWVKVAGWLQPPL